MPPEQMHGHMGRRQSGADAAGSGVVGLTVGFGMPMGFGMEWDANGVWEGVGCQWGLGWGGMGCQWDLEYGGMLMGFGMG